MKARWKRVQSHRTYDPIIRMVFHDIKMCCTSLSFLISCHLFSPSIFWLFSLFFSPTINFFFLEAPPLPHENLLCYSASQPNCMLTIIFSGQCKPVRIPDNLDWKLTQSGYRITWIESLLLGQSESDLLCLPPPNKRIDRLESIRLGHPPKMSSTLLTPGTTLDDEMCET